MKIARFRDYSIQLNGCWKRNLQFEIYKLERLKLGDDVNQKSIGKSKPLDEEEKLMRQKKEVINREAPPTMHTPISGDLHWLCPLPRTFFPQVSAQFTLSTPGTF